MSDERGMQAEDPRPLARQDNCALEHEIPASPLAAFPGKLALQVTHLQPILQPASGQPAIGSVSVMCDGEVLQIPGRIYWPPISAAMFASLSPLDQSIVACWFTRHHDGYVRERFLRALPTFERSWVVGYVVLLCGEYVVELLSHVWECRGLFDHACLGRWLRENHMLYAKTRRRMISYWDCYHRSSHPEFKNYVGRKLFDYFDDCLALVEPQIGAD